MFTPLLSALTLLSALVLSPSEGKETWEVYGPFDDCDEITLVNFTYETQHFLIGFDCDGDGEYDVIADEAFVPLRLEGSEPSKKVIKKKWWYPCRISHLIYVGPSGGGKPADVRPDPNDPCRMEIH